MNAWKRSFLTMLLVMVLMAALIGCAGVTVATNDTAYIAGKAAGIYVATKYPATKAAALPYAAGLLSIAKDGTFTSDQMTAAIAALYSSTGDNAELSTLVMAMTSAVTIEIKAGVKNDQVVSVLEGFISGLQLGVTK